MERYGFNMNYGVTITSGVCPWQIFQQKDGKSDISINGAYTLIHLSQELPLKFAPVGLRKVTIKARIVRESSGESVLPWQLCSVLEDGRWETVFKDVPAGGLYRIETYMDYDGWDGLSVTRGDMVHNVGVGDIFVIAGQSNAAGRSKNPVEDPPELGVHLLRNSGRWELATHPLGETTGAIHTGHFENHNPGHCPYLHFSKILKRELGYPIGLVQCAYGGSPLRWWNPDENGALFDNMLEMLGEYSIVPKGVLWYQGEAEGFEESASTYLERFAAFAGHLRRALNSPELPFITVQLNRCMTPSNDKLDREWGMVREAQRRAAHVIKGVYTVPSLDVALYDFIHNSSEGDLVIGERCAKAALTEIYGRHYDWHAPEAIKAVRISEDTLSVELDPIRNWINPFDVPPEFFPFNVEDEDGLIDVKEYRLEDQFIIITFKHSFKDGAVLHGAWRMNPGPAVPFDCMRLPLLSFYGLPVK